MKITLIELMRKVVSAYREFAKRGRCMGDHISAFFANYYILCRLTLELLQSCIGMIICGCWCRMNEDNNREMF